MLNYVLGFQKGIFPLYTPIGRSNRCVLSIENRYLLTTSLFLVSVYYYQNLKIRVFYYIRIIINEISHRLGHNDVFTALNVSTHTNLAQEKRVFKTLNSLKIQSIL